MRLYLGYLSIFIGILTSASIIVLKDKDDILQGISQLDHLIKVSIFQVFKGGRKNKKHNDFSGDGDITDTYRERVKKTNDYVI